MAILVCCSCCSGALPQSLCGLEFGCHSEGPGLARGISLQRKMSGKLQITDARLEPITNKVLAGERLSAEDGLALFQSNDLLAVGWLANHVREQRHGNICYFNVNRHINPTNVCVAHCKLCAFGRSPDVPGA